MAQTSVHIKYSDLAQTIQNNELLKKHSDVARRFNKLGRQHLEMRIRCQKVDDVIRDVSGISPLSPSTRQFMERHIHEHVSDAIRTHAMNNPKIASALDSPELKFQESITEGLVLRTSLTIYARGLRGLAVNGALFPEAVAIGLVLFAAYEAYSHIEANIEQHKVELRRYEHHVHERTRLSANNQPKLRLDRSQTQPIQLRPPYFRARWHVPLTDAPERPSSPQPKGLSGKFLGVLSECEPVENSNDKLVVTFDAISISLTTNGPHSTTVDLRDINALDPYQKEEVLAQLEIIICNATQLSSLVLFDNNSN